jgi:hypothetical protein
MFWLPMIGLLGFSLKVRFFLEIHHIKLDLIPFSLKITQ